MARMLRTKSEDWVKKFLALDGLQVLFEVLVGTSENQAEMSREDRAERLRRNQQQAVLEGRDPHEIDDDDDGEGEALREGEEPGAQEGDGEEGDEEEEEDRREMVVSPSHSEILSPRSMDVEGSSHTAKNDDPFDLLQSECIKAIRTLMNVQIGMKAFLSNNKAVEMIARSLDSENLKTKVREE